MNPLDHFIFFTCNSNDNQIVFAQLHDQILKKAWSVNQTVPYDELATAWEPNGQVEDYGIGVLWTGTGQTAHGREKKN